MDVFALRDKVVADYRGYIESFVRIRDEQIREFVQGEFASGKLWPDVILQLNPAYEPGATVDELAARGRLAGETARFFRNRDGSALRLYRHQMEALEIAGRQDPGQPGSPRNEPYVVTTGTGSGKSLTYLVPIYDRIVRSAPERHRVRAILVYPMNALINSQYNALKEYHARFPQSPVRFAQYTGQEKDEVRELVLNDPPHILLTNYVMLEYMLLRPRERVFTDRATANLEFLVLDELHTYRGRQGADVAMLVRRLRERCGNPKLLSIGTSATMATEGDRAQRKAAAADVAAKLFGVPVPRENVVDETLRRAISAPAPRDASGLRAAVAASLPEAAIAAFGRDPLAAWVEERFGVRDEDGRLVRQEPISFKEGARRLAQESGLPEEVCAEKLKALLALGNSIKTPSGEPLFAFRLHQFLAGGGTVHATLESPPARILTLEGQRFAPSDKGDRLLYPLVFCRECGQEYYLVEYRSEPPATLLPRLPFLDPEDVDDSLKLGYAALEQDELWSADDEQDLPEHWFESRGNGRVLKGQYRPYRPQELFVQADGRAAATPSPEDAARIWFQPRPFLLCLRCGAAYDRADKSDFRKLTRLSHTGRSTATTIVSNAALVQLQQDGSVEREAQKLLSFTDNRQDASLQAGHFNDLVQVALVRSALYRALQESEWLDDAGIPRGVFRALALDQSVYAKQPAPWGPGKARNEDAFQRLLRYRVYEDLRRGWRIIQPNLEQCGLLRIDYLELASFCGEADWSAHPILRDATPETRERVTRAFLDHLRREMALDAQPLDPAEHSELRSRVQQNVKELWGFDSEESLRESAIFLLPGSMPNNRRERSMGPNSIITRYLRNRATWNLARALDPREGEELIRAFVAVLRGQYLAVVDTETARDAGIQLMVGMLQWRRGDGTPPEPDPVRMKRMRSERIRAAERQANQFFARLYAETARLLNGIEGQAHTAQVPAEVRQQRERQFRKGELSALFCSPTMELGIDIRDLNMVHLRNVPPTPANYAQRSGRAGRGGQPALVVTFCGEASAHDQYFFRRQPKMVAGAVTPARLDLGNEELVRAHLHSLWIAAVGLSLGAGMADVLDLETKGYPLIADIQSRLLLSAAKRQELEEECRRILDAGGLDVRRAAWNREGWLDRTLDQAPARFDRAFDRWRELYAAAVRQRDDARRIKDDPRKKGQERNDAKRQEREAEHQIELLLKISEETTESDFYPYRYLASEGFLPGYNFPRLPIRAMLPVGDKFHVVDRPRFLALREFGPRNIVYHEGRKYRMNRCVLPPGGVESRLTRAKLCKACGYFHAGDSADRADRCDHCNVLLDAERSEYIRSLFDMTTVRGQRVERITCDEEERVREGYLTTTHFRFAPGPDGGTLQERGLVSAADGTELLRLAHGPQSVLLLINQRWRRARQSGFTLNATDGYWAKRPDEEGPQLPGVGADIRTDIRPFVQDTRNILLIQPVRAAGDAVTPITDEAELASLSYALDRGFQVEFQVEDRELAVNRIGEEDPRLLFWEAAEGGTGVWLRVMEDPGALARVARRALAVCHFDESGRDLAGADVCARACYDCLLSYTNQADHALLDRHRIRDFLLQLASSTTARISGGRNPEQQFAWLAERLDGASRLEADLLAVLQRTSRRPPDRAQYRPEADVYAEADFFYEREGVRGACVFCDGPDHDQPGRRERDDREREKLADRGYRIVVIRYDQDLEQQARRYMDVFGPGLDGQR